MKKLFFIFVLLILLVLSACKPIEPDELDIVRINSSRHLSHAATMIADVEGYFEEYGIQLEAFDFNRTHEAIPLAVAGDLDVYAGAISSGVLTTLGAEPNFKMVADRGHVTSDMNCSFQAVVVPRELFESGAITNPEDLKGKKVVTSLGGPSEFLTSSYLALGGLTMEDVEVNDIPKSSWPDLMINASVDALIALELHLSQLVNEGDTVILAGSEEVLGSFQTSGLAFGKRLLTEDPDLGVRFLAAYLKGAEQYNQGKTDRNLEVLSVATEVDVETLRNACWIPISIDGALDFDGVEPFMTWAVDKGYLDGTITEEQFWDPTFLEKAHKLLGN